MRIWIEVDPNVQGGLNQEEFTELFETLKKRSANNALSAMGFTNAKLFSVIGSITVALLLAFVFIFMGIISFAKAGSFESVINSLMPMSAGGAASSGGDNLEYLIKKVQGFLKTFFAQMKQALNTI